MNWAWWKSDEADNAIAIGAAIIGLIFAGAVGGFAAASPDEAVGATTLEPCAVEDATDSCYWNAGTRGNGEGDSFVRIDGIYYYLGSE